MNETGTKLYLGAAFAGGIGVDNLLDYGLAMQQAVYNNIMGVVDNVHPMLNMDLGKGLAFGAIAALLAIYAKHVSNQEQAVAQKAD